VQALAEVCVRRPVFATVLTLLIFVLGLTGYSRLGVDRFPDIDLPVLTITTVLPGASAEDIENDVTDRIEAAVNTIGSIDALRSVSAENLSLVYVIFKLEKDIDVAAQDVRSRLDAILRDLPDGIEPPAVVKIDPGASPILYAALRGPGASVGDITEFADKKVRSALESVGGVGQVSIIGGRDRAIRVGLDADRLQAQGLPPTAVYRALSTENLNVPGGRVGDGLQQAVLRVHGKIEDPDDFARIPVVVMGDRIVEIGDLASVEDGLLPAESSATWNGEPAVLLTVRKQAGSNTVAVVDEIRETLDEMTAQLPAGWTLEVVRDESASIRTGTDAVTEHLVVGAVLAALMVLAFLGSFRSTVIAALAIPTSVFGTFAAMYALGYTLNNITLLALALSVGIVIDDAIVVLENIYRHVEEGADPRVAAVEGTREIGLAVLATTLSLIAVFLPVVFLAGIPGRFLRSFGVTMSVAIAVSLFVSFSLTPMLASRWLKAPVHGQRSVLERFVDTFYRPIERVYLSMLRWSLGHRWVIVLVCFASLGLVPVLGGAAKKGFIPLDDQAHFEVAVRAPEGTAMQATGQQAERLARQIRSWPEVIHTTITVGSDDARTTNLATVYVRLSDPTVRETSQVALMDRVRNDLIPSSPDGWRVTVSNVADVGASGRAAARIQFNLTGPELSELDRISSEVMAIAKDAPGVVDLDRSMDPPKPELGIRVDRQRAADLGVSIADLATTLRLLVGGETVGSFTEDGERYDVRLQANADYRDSREALARTLVPSSQVPGGVPLSSVATITEDLGASAISRLARRRVVTLFANAAPGFGDGQVAETIEKIVREDVGLPDGYDILADGQTELMQETAASVVLGFGLAFVFMYLVLAAQFESWLHPFTILLSLPLTLPFALASLLLFDQGLDLFSVLGIFVLFGIVKKNAILQIDHSNQLRERGLPRDEAVLKANQERLRPILMTTLSFVAGMIPLQLSEGIGSGLNRATAGVVVGGQSLSLLLTLLAVPVVYTLFDDAGLWLGRVFARLRPATPAVDTAEEGA
jgi:HAE1 family hydrophobic/amphiphilic exporter-1